MRFLVLSTVNSLLLAAPKRVRETEQRYLELLREMPSQDAAPELSTFWVCSTETFPEPKEKGDPENNLKSRVIEK